MSDVTCVSTMVSQTRVKAALTADRGPWAVASSSLIRSKIKTFESTPMPIVRIKPGDSRERERHRDVGHDRQQNEQVQHHRDQRVDARQAVVGEHEQQDEAEAAERRQHAGANRRGAKARADRALLDVLQIRGQRARVQG